MGKGNIKTLNVKIKLMQFMYVYGLLHGSTATATRCQWCMLQTFYEQALLQRL